MNNINLETILLFVSFAILLGSIVYWLWSNIQLIQKKTSLLEASFIELRSILQTSLMLCNPSSSAIIAHSDVNQESAVQPVEQYQDVEDEEDWSQDVPDVPDVPDVTDSQDVQGVTDVTDVTDVQEDLAPGGMIFSSLQGVTEVQEDLEPGGMIFSSLQGVTEVQEEEVTEAPEAQVNTVLPSSSVSVTSQTSSSTFESMPLRELRRIAEHRGISGAHEMRRKDLVVALRNL